MHTKVPRRLPAFRIYRKRPFRYNGAVAHVFALSRLSVWISACCGLRGMRITDGGLDGFEFARRFLVIACDSIRDGLNC